MKGRRILFIGGSGDPGGLHVHTADVANAAASLGVSVKIISVEKDYFSELLAPGTIEVEHIARLSYQKLTLWPGRYRLSRFSRWASVLLRHPGHDIVFCRGAFGETPLIEMLVSKALFRRSYTIEHSPLAFTWRSAVSKPTYGSLMSACVRRTIAVSSEIAGIATGSFGMAPARVRTCPNWVDPIFVPPSAGERTAARERLGVAAEVEVIGYLGRLGREKNLDVLVDAFAALRRRKPRARSVLLIAGDGWLRGEIEEHIRSSPVRDEVRLVGWQSNPLAIYHALDVFVLPSPSEGFPLGLMEAMATGCPCIAHDMSSTRQLIEHRVNGLISDISTPDRLADTLAAFLEIDALGRERMGAAAARTIATAYSRQARLPAVLAALDIGLGEAGLPPPVPRALTYKAEAHAMQG